MTAHQLDPTRVPVNPLLDDLVPSGMHVTRAGHLLDVRQTALDAAVRYAIARGQLLAADVATGGPGGPAVSVTDTARAFERWLLRAPDGGMS